MPDPLQRVRPVGSGDRLEPSDAELLHRMQLGEERGLELLYARYGGLVFTLALRIVGDPELAREVLQDTFLRCWDRSESFDAGRGRVPWWLMGIARNRAVDLLRSRPHQARLREREQLPEGSTEAAQPEATDVLAMRHAVVNALQGLSVAQRRAIELAYYGGAIMDDPSIDNVAKQGLSLLVQAPMQSTDPNVTIKLFKDILAHPP